MAQFNPLSKREREVVKLLLQGKSNKLIASSLGISNRTVEFHLKNIYAKFQVSSRVELILKLGKATGQFEIEELGSSLVDRPGQKAENRDASNPQTDWGTSFSETVSILGQELEMKNLLNKHVLVGVMAALLTGFLWVSAFRHFGHMSLQSIEPWIAPLIVVLVLVGLAVGLVGKRNENGLGKVFFSTLLGAGVGAFAMIPLVGFVVYPLAKLAEWLGLLNRSAVPTEVTSALVIVAMLVLWLLVGVAVGIMSLAITIKGPAQAEVRRHASEHGL